MTENLADVLASLDDLEKARRALTREETIRQVMDASGESREIVAEQVDAFGAMGGETVLELADGEPTTLRDGLNQWLAVLDGMDLGPSEMVSREWVVDGLSTLATYPWRLEESVVRLHDANASLRLELKRTGDDVEVILGDSIIATSGHDPHWATQADVIEWVATQVHRAVLARVIADRDHFVHLSSTDRRSLLRFLEQPNGSWRAESDELDSRRLRVDAMEGGGVAFRTRPYQSALSPRLRARS